MEPKRSLSARAHAQRAGTGFLRHPAAARLGIVIALFAIWEAAARWYVDPMFLSPPSRVVSSLGVLLRSAGVVRALALTFWELSAAFLLSVIIGVAVGLAVGLHRFSYHSIRPIILLLYAIPQVTILPLFILYFGIGPAAKIAYGVSHGIFPIIVNVIAGVQNIKPILLLSARSMGASRRQIFRWVVLPHMIPSFFTGMRLGMTAVLLGVLLAELYVSSAGIGYFTRRFTESFDPTKLFGLVALVAAMAIALNEIVRRAEIKFGKWRAD
ncbi:MAG: ABC transporter permease [Alphaproteobacteria bacterium]